MKEILYKILAGLFIVFFSVVIILAVLFIFLSSPQSHQQEWLDIEKTMTAFIQNITLPIKISRLSWLSPDKEIFVPVYDVRVREIGDTWMSPRPDGRSHEGQDIFADKNTPVFSATNGIVMRTGFGELGGNFVYVVGAGGRRYYYAHLEKIADGIERGVSVTTDTVLGFVGNTGNAENTPYHLHFGIYSLRKAIDPLPLLINR